MSEYLAPIEVLIEKFRTLPGVGRKTAARFALSVLDMTNEQCEDFAQALLDAKSKIHRCPRCQNLTDLPLCSICLDESRARVICVVEDAKALMSIERIRDYRGRYHVLDAVLSPIKGIGPKQIGLEKLVARIADENIEEVIVATNPTIEGDATAMLIMRTLSPLGIRVTRPALGIPVGADIEYADEITLARAIKARNTLDS